MIANARIARTNAKPTSSRPHHFGKSAVFFERPATAGNAEEMTNSTAADMARGRAQGRCCPVTWGAAGEFAGESIWSEGMCDCGGYQSGALARAIFERSKEVLIVALPASQRNSTF